ncbi:hypothetical protein F4678DRAFT_432407 [Xylaria arbuscula]|nr:hypothetical protein F4678DRAFT_432407 [Xylaria arbuscula]
MTPHAASPQLPLGSLEDRGPPFRDFLISLTTISTLATVLRFWSRSLNRPRLKRSRFWWDDWVALTATVGSVAEVSLVLQAVHLGLGKHIWAIPTANLSYLKLMFAAGILFNVSLFLAKTSALLFLSRVFPRHASPPWFNIALPIIHSLNIAWFVGIALGLVLICNPISKNWNFALPGRCGKLTDLYLGNALPSIAIDLAILILPIPLIWGVQTSRTRKACITLVFIMGYSSVIVAIGRLVTVLHAGKLINEDRTYEGIPHYYWVMAEVPIMIVSISLPAMLPLARHIDECYYRPFTSSFARSFANDTRQRYENINISAD